MIGGSYLGIVQWKAALAGQSAPEGHLPGGLRATTIIATASTPPAAP